MSVDAQRALITQYCQGCHNDTTKSGGIALSKLDLTHPEQTAELAEKVIRQLKGGQMPKIGAPRPAAEALPVTAGTARPVSALAACAQCSPVARHPVVAEPATGPGRGERIVG